MSSQLSGYHNHPAINEGRIWVEIGWNLFPPVPTRPPHHAHPVTKAMSLAGNIIITPHST